MFKALVRCQSTSVLSRRSSCLRRSFFFSDETAQEDQFRFSIATMNVSDANINCILKDAAKQPRWQNKTDHDAAVMLVSREALWNIRDPNLLLEIAKSLNGGDTAAKKRFHLVAGVVESIALPPGQHLVGMPGISVVKGHSEYMLPKIAPSDPRPLTSSSALSFSVGRNKVVTLPMARQMCEDMGSEKNSTLVAASFILDGANSSVEKVQELRTKHIRISDGDLSRTESEQMKFWAPLLPLTPRRIVTENLGNIVKGIDIDGKTMPASTELEHSIKLAHKMRIIGSEPETNSGQSSNYDVWALVTPPGDSQGSLFGKYKSSHDDGLAPQPIDALSDLAKVKNEATAYVQSSFENGARFIKVVSGGGGWGSKMGLLALESQEEKESTTKDDVASTPMRLDDSVYAPKGSAIQFYMGVNYIPACTIKGNTPSIVFGTVLPLLQRIRVEEPFMVLRHFGATSTEGVFVRDKSNDESGFYLPGRKLAIPFSRLYVAAKEPSKKSTDGWLDGALTGGLMGLDTRVRLRCLSV